MLRDPAEGVRKLARFVGQPFSPAGAGRGHHGRREAVQLRHAQEHEINRPAAAAHYGNDWYFRKGEAGDWANHMTPDMARRLDGIIKEKLRGSGLSFA